MPGTVLVAKHSLTGIVHITDLLLLINFIKCTTFVFGAVRIPWVISNALDQQILNCEYVIVYLTFVTLTSYN